MPGQKELGAFLSRSSGAEFSRWEKQNVRPRTVYIRRSCIGPENPSAAPFRKGKRLYGKVSSQEEFHESTSPCSNEHSFFAVPVANRRERKPTFRIFHVSVGRSGGVIACLSAVREALQ
jgi:hypothetical protein